MSQRLLRCSWPGRQRWSSLSTAVAELGLCLASSDTMHLPFPSCFLGLGA